MREGEEGTGGEKKGEGFGGDVGGGVLGECACGRRDSYLFGDGFEARAFQDPRVLGGELVQAAENLRVREDGGLWVEDLMICVNTASLPDWKGTKEGLWCGPS